VEGGASGDAVTAAWPRFSLLFFASQPAAFQRGKFDLFRETTQFADRHGFEANTDTLVLATVDQAGKLVTLKTVSLGAAIADNVWYRVSMQDQPVSMLTHRLEFLPRLRAVRDLIKGRNSLLLAPNDAP
jgi:hypothetical protein